ncbi:MAG: hypothetical protein OXS30_03885 [Chloroflexota bacterium]|nr:hypothetical protein [Chloroflexota bacterium]
MVSKTMSKLFKLLDGWLMNLESRYSAGPTKRTILALNSIIWSGGDSASPPREVPTTFARVRALCRGICAKVLRVFVPGVGTTTWPSSSIPDYRTLADLCAEERESCAKCGRAKSKTDRVCIACVYKRYGETVISATECADDTHGKVNVIYYLVAVGGSEQRVGYRLDAGHKYSTDHSKFPGGEAWWVRDRVEVDLDKPCEMPVHCEKCDPSAVKIALFGERWDGPRVSLSDVWQVRRSPDDFYFEFWFRKAWGVGPDELVVEKGALVDALYGEFNYKQVWKLYLEAKRALKAWLHSAGILIAGLGYWIPLLAAGAPLWALALSGVLFIVEVVMVWKVLAWPHSGQHEHWESWRVLNDHRDYFLVNVGSVVEERYNDQYEEDDELGRFLQPLPLETERWVRNEGSG